MGNTFNKEKRDFGNVVDFIATDYILSSNSDDLKKLTNVEHCNELIIMSSKIFQKKLKHKQVEYLHNRIIGDGKTLGEMKKEKVSILSKESCSDDMIKDTDSKSDKLKKKNKERMCIGIAKFYIKIAHIFSAIMKTLNPIYEYIDENGNKVKVSIDDDGVLNKKFKGQIIHSDGICNRRLHILTNGDNKLKYKEFSANPQICVPSRWNTLSDESGIQELEVLYNDVYNYENGTFYKKSETSRKKYLKDLKEIYEGFTHKKIKKINDDHLTDENDVRIENMGNIILRKFNTTECKTKEIKGNVNINLFLKDYTNNIIDFMKKTQYHNKKLLSVIDSLFFIKINKKTKEKKVIINTTLTHDKLDELNEKTKDIVKAMYIDCEKKFNNGIEMYLKRTQSFQEYMAQKEFDEKNREEGALKAAEKDLEHDANQEQGADAAGGVDAGLAEYAGPQEAGAEAAGTEEAGPPEAGAEAAGAEAAGTEEAGPPEAGAGAEAAGADTGGAVPPVEAVPPAGPVEAGGADTGGAPLQPVALTTF